MRLHVKKACSRFRIVSYNGCLWHHLRGRVPPGSILSSYGTTWVYTTVRDFERALSHAEPKSYRRYKKSNALTRLSTFDPVFNFFHVDNFSSFFRSRDYCNIPSEKAV